MHRLVGLMVTVLFGCGGCADHLMERSMLLHGKVSTEAVDNYVRHRFPDFFRGARPIAIVDRSNHWEVYYELPSDAVGGSPVLLIEKDSGKVLRAFRTQ